MMHALIDKVMRLKNPKILASIVPLFHPRIYKKGEALLNQGQLWDKAFFIEHGILRTHITGREGKEFNKSFWLEGTLVFPITQAMEELPSLFSISALEQSVVWQVDSSDFQACLEKIGQWEPLRAELLERLFNHKSQREHDLLMLDGKTRYRKLCETKPALAARVPVAHLASYLGLTDVSLSRIRSQLKESEK